MSDYREERITDLVTKLAAAFFQRESNQQSLITVTRADVSDDLKSATIYITVLPEHKENAALDFAKRQRSELKEYIKKNIRLQRIPFVDIVLDKGEKFRYRMNEILSGNQ